MTARPDAVLELVDAERATLLELVARVPEGLRARQPAPGRWSIVQVLEHLARVDTGVARLLVARGRERPAEPASAEARMTPARAASVRDRAERIEAPARIQPPGSATPDEAQRALAEARAALLEAYLAADPVALDEQAYPHPVIGLLMLRGWMEFVAHHDARHAEQVAEIAAALEA